MQVKRYVGSELAEVLKRINHELGSGAAIIGIRRIGRGGFLGIMRRWTVEVTVAVMSASYAD